MHIKRNIVLADDDDDDRMLFCEVMSSISPLSTITCAHNGQDLLESLSAMHVLPEMIFLDLNMPIMNGIECLVKLKEDKRLSVIPVVIYSTAYNNHNLDLAYDHGACLYIIKPCSIKEIEMMLKKVWDLNLDECKPQLPKDQFLFYN